MVLRRETRINEITVYVPPLVEATIIEHFQFVGYDEWYMSVGEVIASLIYTPYSRLSASF